MRPLLYFSLILLMLACEFEPGGTIFTEVTPPAASDISIEIPVNTNDTIFLFQPVELSYRSILGTHEATLVRVSLNGEEILTSRNPTGSFSFYTPNYPSGNHRLTIELHATGGSGSLADTEGKEALTVKKEYTLSIDLEAPNAIPFTSIRSEDGALKVSWEKYRRKNFQRYLIYKYCYDSFEKRYETCWYKQLSDQDVTSLTDSSFIGGKVKYRISVRGAGQVGPATEGEFEAAYDPQLTWEWLNNDDLQLTWRKPAYYSSFTSYELRFGPYDAQETFIVDELRDTTLIIKPGLKFAAHLDVILSVNPYRINTYNADNVVSRINAYLGTRFPSFFGGSVQYNPAVDKYFIVRRKNYAYELVRVNADDYHEEQKLETLTQTISLSANGAHLCLVEGRTFKKLDPLTFATTATFDLASLDGGSAEWTFSVSDNNILVATNYGGTYVVDMTDFHVIQELERDFSTIISPNGQYLSTSSEIFSFEGGVYVSKMAVPESRYSGREFISADTYLQPVRGTLLVIDLNTASIVNTILIEGGYQGYDPVSGMASGIANGFDGGRKMHLYSLELKDAVAEVDISGNVWLMNNSLVADGLVIPLSSYYP